MPLLILTLFVGRLSARLPLGRFGRISWRPGARGCAGFQLCHVLLGGLPQQHSGAITAGYQQMYMMTEGAIKTDGVLLIKGQMFFLSK